MTDQIPDKDSKAPDLATPGMVLAERYHLIEILAYGGMAQVWKGTDQHLEKTVAIKILHGHLSNDNKFVDRFKREALAVIDLEHNSIVNVYDTISENGIDAMVMELIDGETLREILDRKGKIDIIDTLNIASQIADALQSAHDQNLIHRDIKPANIMVCTDRRVVVTDFGIAKGENDDDLTATGMLLGTAKYLAPEQVSGHEIDTRADIYSLGILVFEMLTGVAPFVGSTEAATALARVQKEPPLVSSKRNEVDDEVDEVVLKAMAKDPKERYQSAEEFRQALIGVDEPRRSVPRPYNPDKDKGKDKDNMFENEDETRMEKMGSMFAANSIPVAIPIIILIISVISILVAITLISLAFS